jgi:hypothetical protein
VGALPSEKGHGPIPVRFPLLAAIVVLLVILTGIIASTADAHPGRHCHTRACPERVAMHQCSQSRPVPCIRRAALRHRVSFHLQLTIARCESGLDPTETNNGGSGASGLMQFMPSTFATTPYALRPLFSAKWNALAGAWLLRRAGTGPGLASRHCGG